MPNRHENLNSLFGDIANSIRTKTGNTGSIIADNFDTEINSIITDPSGSCTATNDTILAGYNAYAGGVLRTGTIPTKTSSDLSASGATVTVPSGYYAGQVTKNISTGAVSATAYSNGNVHFNVTSAGYVDGSKNTYKQYSTKAATTITPSTSAQTAIAANTLATGAVTVAAVANASAGNIKKGVTIAGVTGSVEEGLNFFETIGYPSFDSTVSAGSTRFVTSPANCHKARVYLIGGGGGGMFIKIGSEARMYAGGGSGNLAYGIVNISPNTRYNITYVANSGNNSAGGNANISNGGCYNAANGGSTVFGDGLLTATGGRGATFNMQTLTLCGGDGMAGGGIYVKDSEVFNIQVDNTKTLTLRGGNGFFGGGGGVNCATATHVNFYKLSLIAGNGGMYGGGGGITAYSSTLRMATSTITGIGGKYGGNGGITVYNEANRKWYKQKLVTLPAGFTTYYQNANVDQNWTTVFAPFCPRANVFSISSSSYNALNGCGGPTLTGLTDSFEVGGAGVAVGAETGGRSGGGIYNMQGFGTAYTSYGAGGVVIERTRNSYSYIGYGGQNDSGYSGGYFFVQFIPD